MQLLKVKPETSAKFLVGEERVLLMPIGDIQYGSDTDITRLRKHIQWGVDHGAYFLGMGDYIDYASPSNRTLLSDPRVYDGSREALDDIATVHVDRLIEQALAPSRGRWIGLLEGHHFWSFLDGTTSDEYLCNRLGAPFLGKSAIVGLQFPQGTVGIFGHHGVGGGRRMSSVLNQLDQLPGIFPDVHIFLVAHQHKLVTGRPDQLVVNWKKGVISDRSILLACTGSWMRGYTQNRMQGGRLRPSYVENRLLSPVALGGLVITVEPKTKDGLFIPDIFVSS